MTSVPLEVWDEYYVARHKVTGHQWISNTGKTKFRKPSDLKSAWKRSVMKAKKGEINNIGNAIDIPPLRILKPVNPNSNKPQRYVMPPFDQQNIYVIVKVKSETLQQLDRAKELLRISASHVTFDLRNEITKFLQEGK